jgi:hypothetical protein
VRVDSDMCERDQMMREKDRSKLAAEEAKLAL